MTMKSIKIWIWIHNGRIYKAISCKEEHTFTIYDENDNVLIKRTGLTPAQIKKIEVSLASSGAQRMDSHREPFTYL